MLNRTGWDAPACEGGQERVFSTDCLALLRVDCPRPAVQRLHRPAEVGLGRAVEVTPGDNFDLDSGRRAADSQQSHGATEGWIPHGMDVFEHGRHVNVGASPSGSNGARFAVNQELQTQGSSAQRAKPHLSIFVSLYARLGVSEWGSADDGDTAAFEALLDEEARGVRCHRADSPLPSPSISPSSSAASSKKAPQHGRGLGDQTRSVSGAGR